MKKPNPVWLFRITHIDNLDHVLKHGLVTESSPNANPNFKKIGDSTLIDFRKDLSAPDPPGGCFRDYIPFYFGPRSPMLYQIATGWEDIEKISQAEIIYLITTVEAIVDHGLDFFFSDGHARIETSLKFTDLAHLNAIDWDAVYSTVWKSDRNNLQRKEKKQAEFLVKNHLPLSCIEKIGVYNQAINKKICRILAETSCNIQVITSPKKLYYDHL